MAEAEQPFSDADEALADAIGLHVMQHIGPVTNVLHEIASDLVRVDLLIVGPREGRPFTTVVTCGMSGRAMSVPIFNPEDIGRLPALRFAELMLCLPADWPLTPEAFQLEEHYWPIRWLKKLARLPHIYESWLGVGHTIPNGDPPKPFASNTRFCCWLVEQPLLLAAESLQLRLPDKIINFYSMVALDEAETNIKLEQGMPALTQALDRAHVSELLDLQRRSAR